MRNTSPYYRRKNSKNFSVLYRGIIQSPRTMPVSWYIRRKTHWMKLQLYKESRFTFIISFLAMCYNRLWLNIWSNISYLTESALIKPLRCNSISRKTFTKTLVCYSWTFYLYKNCTYVGYMCIFCPLNLSDIK